MENVVRFKLRKMQQLLLKVQHSATVCKAFEP